MASFNKVILMGNVTRDPEVRYTPGGTAVTDVGLAVNRFWMDKSTNERKEETTFVDVTLWGRTAEIAGEYLSKGRPCLIEGRLQLDQWEDKETGQKRSRLKVVGDSLQLLGGRGDGDGGGSHNQGSPRASSAGSSNAPSSNAPSSNAPSSNAPSSNAPSSSPPSHGAAPQAQESRSPDQAFYDDAPQAPTDDEVPF